MSSIGGRGGGSEPLRTCPQFIFFKFDLTPEETFRDNLHSRSIFNQSVYYMARCDKIQEIKVRRRGTWINEANKPEW